MTKLKTLKEISGWWKKGIDGDYEVVVKRDVKEEAIKWAKDFNKKGHNGMAINYIWNKFFNINKDDLK